MIYFSILSNTAQSNANDRLAPFRWQSPSPRDSAPTFIFVRRIFLRTQEETMLVTNPKPVMPNEEKASSESVSTIFCWQYPWRMKIVQSPCCCCNRLSDRQKFDLSIEKKRSCSGFSLFTVQLEIASQN